MMRRIALFVPVVLALAAAGCGEMSRGFQKGFDDGFKKSCVEGAVKKGVEKATAEKVCDCTLVKFKETKSMDKAVAACTEQTK